MKTISALVTLAPGSIKEEHLKHKTKDEESAEHVRKCMNGIYIPSQDHISL